ncbi:hypothetical protein ACO2Q0_08525 [Phenylobacterium sp. VNQ135]|uniref:hypothetical protein n=1 Tax=Phenylobacterium sp. VNQ135 TaxID=3400922 RepID=UPI003C0FE1FE
MLVDQAQAFALALREQLGRMAGGVVTHRHDGLNKRRLWRSVYFSAKFAPTPAFFCRRLTDR